MEIQLTLALFEEEEKEPDRIYLDDQRLLTGNYIKLAYAMIRQAFIDASLGGDQAKEWLLEEGVHWLDILGEKTDREFMNKVIEEYRQDTDKLKVVKRNISRE